MSVYTVVWCELAGRQVHVHRFVSPASPCQLFISLKGVERESVGKCPFYGRQVALCVWTHLSVDRKGWSLQKERQQFRHICNPTKVSHNLQFVQPVDNVTFSREGLILTALEAAADEETEVMMLGLDSL